MAQSNFDPVEEHTEEVICTVTMGSIPTDLYYGKYIRNGPNAVFNLKGNEHWADGNGMLHCVTFHPDGSVTYKNRYVYTDLLVAEKKSNSQIYPSLMTLLGNSLWKLVLQVTRYYGLTWWHGIHDPSKANTNIIQDTHRLLALSENGCPYAVDPTDLSTIGKETFDGAWGTYRDGFDGFSAHPKRCPESGELYIIGYDPFYWPHLRYSVIDKDGCVLINRASVGNGISHDTPVMVHDFCVTQNYVIVCAHPLIFNPLRPMIGKKSLDFFENRPCRWLIFGKYEPEVIILAIEQPAYAVFHFANAWDDCEASRVTVYGCKSNNVNFRELASSALSYMTKWQFDLSNKSVTEEVCNVVPVDFPVINPQNLGKPCTDIYASLQHTTNGNTWDTVKMNGLVKFDLESGKLITFRFPDRIYGIEATLVNGRHLVTFVHDENKNKSQLWVVCAKTMIVICTIDIPYRVPYGFHGIFISF